MVRCTIFRYSRKLFPIEFDGNRDPVVGFRYTSHFETQTKALSVNLDMMFSQARCRCYLMNRGTFPKHPVNQLPIVISAFAEPGVSQLYLLNFANALVKSILARRTAAFLVTDKSITQSGLN